MFKPNNNINNLDFSKENGLSINSNLYDIMINDNNNNKNDNINKNNNDKEFNLFEIHQMNRKGIFLNSYQKAKINNNNDFIKPIQLIECCTTKISTFKSNSSFIYEEIKIEHGKESIALRQINNKNYRESDNYKFDKNNGIITTGRFFKIRKEITEKINGRKTNEFIFEEFICMDYYIQNKNNNFNKTLYFNNLKNINQRSLEIIPKSLHIITTQLNNNEDDNYFDYNNNNNDFDNDNNINKIISSYDINDKKKEIFDIAFNNLNNNYLKKKNIKIAKNPIENNKIPKIGEKIIFRNKNIHPLDRESIFLFEAIVTKVHPKTCISFHADEIDTTIPKVSLSSGFVILKTISNSLQVHKSVVIEPMLKSER